MTQRVELKRLGWAGLLGAVILSLCGCVYLRLNSLRIQLKDFDRYVALGGEPDLALTFKRPVLWADDLATLFKQPPTEQRQSGQFKTNLWILEKKPTTSAENLADFRFTFTTVATNEKLSQLVIPRELLRVVPREAAVRMLKAMGHARVKTGQKSADTEFQSDQFACTTKDVARLLGIPHEMKSAATTSTWAYRFVLRPPPGHRAAGMKVAARFVFRAEDDRMINAQIEFGGHQVNVKM